MPERKQSNGIRLWSTELHLGPHFLMTTQDFGICGLEHHWPKPSVLITRAAPPCADRFTFSVMPSDSIMIM